MHGFRPPRAVPRPGRPHHAALRFLCGAVAGDGRRRRDSRDYAALLRSRCASVRTLKQAHQQIITAGYGGNPFLAAKLVALYADLGGGDGMRDARRVFDGVDRRDALLWNVVIRGYAAAGPPEEALAVYALMRRSGGAAANRYTYPFVLKACAAAGDSGSGRTVHGEAWKVGLATDLFVGNALVAFYARCGDLHAARHLFDGMPDRDLVSWNSLIAGYSQNECHREALSLFHRMLREDPLQSPDYVTLAGLLPACAKLAAARDGMWVHCYAVKSGTPVDAVLGSGLVGMYAACGRLAHARDVFDRIPLKNVVTWNAMISGYGAHGRAQEALALFAEMLSGGVHADGVCFLSVLSACSHAGLVEEGRSIFELMEEHGVEKGELHYGCMVDLLDRAGLLREATELAGAAPGGGGRDVWGALLGACRKHGEVETAEHAAGRLFELEPGNAGRYAAMARTYEGAGRGEDAARVRVMMRARGVRKTAGCSWVEVQGGGVHLFGVEDQSHPRTEEIYGVLQGLGRVLEMEEKPCDWFSTS